VAKTNSWIKAFRLRTLPLALSSILTGSFLAIHDGNYRWQIIALAMVTTVLLQVLSNLANDYGDAVKGTDNEHRLGPQRTVQSGEITPKQMKTAMVVFVILTLISGIWLLFESFGDDWPKALLFLLLGLAAIAAAIKYTVGKTAYGYAGLGDLFVFLFFGLLGVIGTYYLNTKSFSWLVLLPATTLGLFSTAVLNLNNTRDMENDLKSGKKTVAARLGYKNALYYQVFLITVGFLTAFLYVLLTFRSYWEFLFLLTLPLFVANLAGIYRVEDQQKLDPYLKKTALGTLLFVIVFGIGLIL
jgi:1,4-dihydroxy-2-naphthoate octaprenyltransferase